MENLSIAFPEKSEQERKKLQRLFTATWLIHWLKHLK
jgi:lauroyl/myristoyl acyltransferase